MITPPHQNKEVTPEHDLLVDASGLVCPEPVMLLHSAVCEASSGQIIKLVATDPSTLRDVPKFCRFLGHQLIHKEEASRYLFFIRRS
ncbi:MAG TPA: sulfurtransferase TusA [Porticoccaceae bacterium]|nr:sulfurtransferase TusA [Porticoccaceae bacterium]